jgi:hypothetical protein
MRKIELVRQITEAANGKFCGAIWIKKTTGKIRRGRWNPKDHAGIKGTGKAKDKDSSIYSFRECHCETDPERKTAWRSFDAEYLLRLTANGETWDFTLDEPKIIKTKQGA